MDMGTGKSKVIVDEWGERVEARDLSDLLIWAPAGCYRNWDLTRSPDEPSEFLKHLDPAIHDRMVCVPWVSGGGVQWKRQMDAMLACRDRPRVLVMNIEAMSSVKKAREACEEFLRSSVHGAMAAVDESPTIRNPTADRTVAVQKLGHLARVRRLLTGLVAPRSPMDLYSQFEFLDWRILGFRSFYGFRARYAVLQRMQYGGRSFLAEVAYRNIPELNEKIAPYSYRVLQEECLDLDPKVYTRRDIPLTDEQARIYRELRQYATSQISELSHVTATSVITQMLRLHQVLCGHVTDEEGVVRDIPERRTAGLLNVLEDYAGKAIIWVTYEHTLLKVAAELEKVYGPGSVARFWGGNRSTRGEDESRFKTDPRCRFMVATEGAGGRGNTWVVANLVVYYSNTPDWELRDQSEARPYRDGQTGSVTYVDLVTAGTVDEKFLQIIRKKINISTAINGDNYREWLI
jgi:SNF2 family DNA or RNA helicase